MLLRALVCCTQAPTPRRSDHRSLGNEKAEPKAQCLSRRLICQVRVDSRAIHTTSCRRGWGVSVRLLAGRYPILVRSFRPSGSVPTSPSLGGNAPAQPSQLTAWRHSLVCRRLQLGWERQNLRLVPRYAFYSHFSSLQPVSPSSIDRVGFVHEILNRFCTEPVKTH